MAQREKFDVLTLTDKDKQLLNKFTEKRKLFDAYIESNKLELFTCPGCGYPTLSERGGYEICAVCNWEDDGQDNEHADEIWGGPNQRLTLIENRINIGKALEEIADRWDGAINLHPDEIMRAFKRHEERMNAFDDDEMMDATTDDPIWKAWAAQKKVLLHELIKR